MAKESRSVTNNRELGNIGEVTKEIANKAERAIEKARVRLLLNQPFFGTVIMRMPTKDASKWCGTLATDGKHIFYNANFVLKLPVDELIFALAHELGHAIYDHLRRFRDAGAEMQLSNVAADLVVNGDLVQHKIGSLIKTIPILHDSKFYGWTYEQTYAYLDKRHRQRNGGGNDQDKPSQGQGGSQGQDKTPGGNPSTGDSELDKMIDQILDDHLDGQGGNDPNQSDGDNQAPVISDSEMEEFHEEMMDTLRQAAQSSGADNIPLGMKRLLDDLQEPKVDWRELIQQQIDALYKSDFSFLRPSRRSAFSQVILPGMIPEKTIDICVTVDMSGSISSQQARIFFSEIKGIMEMYDNFKIHLWTFDTRVYNPQVFTPENLEDLESYDIQGGGGTDFMCNWEWMKENEIYPEKFLMFTDGYPCGSWGLEEYCDTIFLIHGATDITSPFGITVHYEDYE